MQCRLLILERPERLELPTIWFEATDALYKSIVINMLRHLPVVIMSAKTLKMSNSDILG